MYNEAIREFQKTTSLSSEPDFKASAGHAYAKMGDNAAPSPVLGDLEGLAKEKRGDPFGEALIYTALGDRDRAFRHLQEAYDQRTYWITTIKTDWTTRIWFVFTKQFCVPTAKSLARA